MRRRLPLVAVLAGAAIVRLVVLTTTAARLDGDEAVTGIMARRILEGHHLAFFAGQSYMGSGEQYLQAVTLAVLPDTDLTLRLPQVALAVAACALVHAVALRCGLSPRRAIFAAALFAVGPYFAVLWSVKSTGAYDLALVAGLAGVLVALSAEPDEARLPARAATFGLICGVAAWSNLQAAYVLLPAGWWLLATLRGRLLRTLPAALVGFAVGAAPSLFHLLFTGPLEVAGAYPPSSVAGRAGMLVDSVVPNFLGVKAYERPRFGWLPPAFVVLAVVGIVGAAIAARWAGIGDVLRLRRRRRRGIDLLLLSIAAAPLLFVQSGAAGTDGGSPRYVFALYGVVPVLVAATPVPRWLAGRARAIDVAAAIAVACLLVHTITGVRYDVDTDAGGNVTESRQRVRSEDLGPVVDALEASGARTAYADYWLAQVLQWRAGDRLVVETTYSRRFPHATRAAAADPSPALVVAMSEAAEVADALRRRGSTFDQTEVAGWTLFTDVEPGQHPGEAPSVTEGLAGDP